MREREDLSLIVDRCLQALAAGATLEQVLAMYPQQGPELREALLIAEALRDAGQKVSVPAHAQSASKAQFLAHAEQLKKPKGLAAFWRWLNMPRPNLGSLVFGLAILALVLLAISSTQALPGDQLYPVKLAAEQASLSMIEDPADRLLSEENFDQKRADEVQKVLVRNRKNNVTFAGFLKKDKNGEWLAAGIPLEISEAMRESAGTLTGVYIEVKGQTLADGRVHVETLNPRLFEIEGVVNDIKTSGWMVGRLWVQRTGETTISGDLVMGSRVRVNIARIENRDDVLAFHINVLDAPASTLTPTPTFTPQRDPVQGPAPSLTPGDSSDDEEPEITDTPAPEPTGTHDDDDGDDEEEDDEHKSDEDDHREKSPTPGR